MRVLTLFLAAVVLLFAAPAARASGRVALVVGNASYGPAVGALRNPTKDAALVATALRARGFSVTVVENVSRVALLGAVRSYARALAAAGPGAVGFFYYSGHGVANPESRRNYLVPIDASTAADDRLWDESVPLDEVVRTITTAARGATNLVVFDACRDQLALPRGRGLGGGKGLERVETQESTLIAFSTSPEKTAADLDTVAATGPYATELAKALGTDGIDVKTMFDNVKFAVLKRTGRKQQPWVEDGLAERIFLGPARPAAIVQPTTATIDAATLDALAWQGALKADRADAYRDYLRRYPSGAFSTLAQANLDRLAGSAAVVSARPGLIEPTLVSPSPDERFDGYPREKTHRWLPVPGATRYKIEIQYCQQGVTDCRAWHDSITSSTEVVMGFAGAQPGRWRVTALGKDSDSGRPSDWRVFYHSR